MRLENVTFFSKTDNIEIWKCNLKKKERPHWDLKMQLFFQTQTILRLENVAFFSKTDNHETWKCNFNKKKNNIENSKCNFFFQNRQ